MPAQPLVSCICPTYKRYPDHGHLLEETVESFLRQDYSNKELVILNDCSEQKLNCTYPGVRVINWPDRFLTLGNKYNKAIEEAHGDLIMPWEDDDISLPHRISQAVYMLGEYDYWKPQQVIYLPKGSPPIFDHPVGVRHHASIYRRSAWEAVQGYPANSGAQDAMFDSALRHFCEAAPEVVLLWREWAYIYRWGVSPWHLSGFSNPEKAYQDIARQPVNSARYDIVSRWQEDYEELVRCALDNLRQDSRKVEAPHA